MLISEFLKLQMTTTIGGIPIVRINIDNGNPQDDFITACCV